MPLFRCRGVVRYPHPARERARHKMVDRYPADAPAVRTAARHRRWREHRRRAGANQAVAPARESEFVLCFGWSAARGAEPGAGSSLAETGWTTASEHRMRAPPPQTNTPQG